MTREISIVIADDHPIFRTGLVSTIESNDGMKVVGLAENGLEAIALAEERLPDVVILDIDMPVMDGIEAAKALRDRDCPSKTIFLTMHKDNSILRSLRSLNVLGYVLKDSADEEIEKCIRTVMEGRVYFSPALNDIILDSLPDPSQSDAFKSLEALTNSEKKILRCISESKTNKEIAEELFISIRTVETHRSNISTKLGLNGPNRLLKFALQNKNKLASL